MKAFKKSLCLLLTLVMLVMPMAQTAFGQENSVDGYQSVNESYDEDDLSLVVTEQSDGTYEAVVDRGMFYDAMKSSTIAEELNAAYRADGIMYNQLNDRQKAYYNFMDETSVDAVLAAPNYRGDANKKMLTKSIPGVNGATFTGYISNGTVYVAESQKASFESIMNDMLSATVAYYYDAPAAIWAIDVSAYMSVSSIGNNTLKIESSSLIYNLAFQGREKQMYNEMNAAVDNIIASVVDPNADRYTKLSSIYEYIIKNNKYSNDLARNPIIIHLPYSALIIGDAYDPVCNGYSSAIKMICDKLRIPCVMATSMDDIAGEGHAWNNVKMDDGYWYNMDATNDGTNSPEVGKKFFLVGSDELKKYGDFFKENGFWGNNIVNFKFPTKNTYNYEYIGGPKFPDIKPSDWFYRIVLDSAKTGLFRGDEEGRFNPEKSITRGEFASVLANMYKADTAGFTSTSFPDVKSDAWFLKSVEWAKSKGYMNGDKDGRFRPNANISRQEMCIVFANIEGKRQDSPAEKFQDSHKIADYAYSAVYHCKEIGLVSGDDHGNFNPTSPTKRSEASSVFLKYHKIINEN